MIHFLDLATLNPFLAHHCVTYIAEHMRQSDVDELNARLGLTPLEALSTSIHISSHGWVIVDGKGKPIAMFGAAPIPDQLGKGAMWLLGTDGVERHGRRIALNTRRYLDRMNDAYPYLWNYVDARNAASLRWLHGAGCKIVGEVPEMGVERRPFLIVAREA
ncbi:MAG TPA: hypothetical protein VF503_27735 [Sphingobium sp.]|uniref:hypothetical protein n=1 Tax=Sphingobium sp. TaxID=1912891 RepID=UPI002ED03268